MAEQTPLERLSSQSPSTTVSDTETASLTESQLDAGSTHSIGKPAIAANMNPIPVLIPDATPASVAMPETLLPTVVPTEVSVAAPITPRELVPGVDYQVPQTAPASPAPPTPPPPPAPLAQQAQQPPQAQQVPGVPQTPPAPPTMLPQRNSVFPQYTMLVTDSGPPEILPNYGTQYLGNPLAVPLPGQYPPQQFPPGPPQLPPHQYLPPGYAAAPQSIPPQSVPQQSNPPQPVPSQVIPSQAVPPPGPTKSYEATKHIPEQTIAAMPPEALIGVTASPYMYDPTYLSVPPNAVAYATRAQLYEVPSSAQPTGMPQSYPPPVHPVPPTLYDSQQQAPRINTPMSIYVPTNPYNPSLQPHPLLQQQYMPPQYLPNQPSPVQPTQQYEPPPPTPTPYPPAAMQIRPNITTVPTAPFKSTVLLSNTAQPPNTPEIQPLAARGDTPGNTIVVDVEITPEERKAQADSARDDNPAGDESRDSLSPRESESAESATPSVDPLEVTDSASDDLVPEAESPDLENSPTASDTALDDQPQPDVTATQDPNFEGFPQFKPQIQETITLKPSMAVPPQIPRMPAAESTVLFGFLGSKTLVAQQEAKIVIKKEDAIDEDETPPLEGTITSQPISAKASKKKWIRKHGLPGSLECLDHVDMILIEKSYDSKIVVGVRKGEEMFLFKNKDGRTLFYAVEQPVCWSVNYCPSGRPFGMKLYDSTGEEVINFMRKMSCVAGCFLPCLWQSILTYCPPSCLLGTVEEDFTLCIPKFTVYNSTGAGIFTLRGPIGASICNQNIDFLIYQRDEYADIGMISQSWPDENLNLYKREVYGIRFPIDLDCKVKILLTSAATLINYIYYQMPKVTPAAEGVPVPEIVL